MKIIYLIPLVALVAGCSKPAPPPSGQQHWEYNKFQFQEANTTDFGTDMLITTVTFTDTPNRRHQDFFAVDELLNAIGQYGWDLSWTDGTNYIVKRPQDAFTNGDFYVSTDMVPTNAP